MKSVQMEDTIEALLDYFVSPLLSINEFRGKPLSDHQQTLMAKQLNAVVVLYNYYHRKQFPDLEFLDFKNFFKICCISKPSLLPYLRYMHKCEEDSENINNQYSITEEKVIDACNLCLELDSCKENRVMDAWPVLKVAVFLVDSKKEKCALLNSHATQGVWSIVEKELAGPDKKFLQIDSWESEKILEKLAFSAVETYTGLSFKNLLILERQVTYSLSCKKTSTWLYIMKYEGKLSNDIAEVIIEDVKASLEGPIVQKDSTCEVTPVVKYYNMLPYYETISSWFSREKNAKQVDACKKVSLDFTEDHNTKTRYVKPSKSGTIIETDEKTPSLFDIKADIEANGPDRLNAEKDHLMNNMVSLKENNNVIVCNKKNQSKDETVRIEIGADKEPENKADENHGISNTSIPNEQNLDPKTRSLNGMETIAVDNNLPEGPSNDEASSATNSCMLVDTYRSSFDKDNEFNKTSCSKNLDSNSNIMILTDGLDTKQIIAHTSSNSELPCATCGLDLSNDTHMQAYNLTMKDGLINNEALPTGLNNIQQPKHHRENIISDSKMIQENNPNHHACKDAGQARMVKPCLCFPSQIDSTLGELPLVPVHFNSEDNSTLASKKNKLLQELRTKVNELHQRKQLLEDEIACCEMNIQIILKEGDNSGTSVFETVMDEASHCSKQMQNNLDPFSKEGCTSLSIKRRKLSEAVLSSRNFCQELDDICHRNSWMLPRYTVIPYYGEHDVTGAFEATVELHGPEFNFRSVGDKKSSPREARESAASRILSKLRI